MYCKTCAMRYSLLWKDSGLLTGVCGICCERKVDCYERIYPFVPEDKDIDYVDPIYLLSNKGYIDLSRLCHVSAVTCYLISLQVSFNCYFANCEDYIQITRKMANNEITTMPNGKSFETFIKLVDGSQIAQTTATDLPLDRIFAVKVFEEERQKLITAWRNYKKFVFKNRFLNEKEESI